MGNISARGAAVTPTLTIGQALVDLAPELDPELCRIVAAADGVDLQWFIAGSGTSLVDWSPTFDVLRQPFGLNHRRRQLRVELLNRLRAGIWKLVWLPDDPTQAAKAFDADQLADLAPENLDPDTSTVILGGTRHRVRVIADPSERTIDPPDPGANPSDEAMPAEDAAGGTMSQTTSDEPPITSEADAAQTYLERLTKERESTGHPPTREADYYEWAPWVWKQWRFRVTQQMIDGWRRILLTVDEKKGGAPRHRK